MTNALHHYIAVIAAAERGDYCHGNGALFTFVDRLRSVLYTVNTVTGATYEASLADPATVAYLATTPARRDVATADRLRSFVATTYGFTF